ncbi:5'-AMP-activated protein kinase beta subunit, interation domain-containing protein [Hysterangium stoloniferum]|nr:5'-AMP-activated protein kinase beta subunit, interation domain-containing protein [Hysterangium stoloniferum]
MGNTNSHPPNSNRPPPAATSSASNPPSRSRPLGTKSKKRSIIDHPPLAPHHPQQHTNIPSNPIPIPTQPDYVPDLLLNQRSDLLPQHPLQYNSTRSFGVVRRGEQHPPQQPIIEEVLEDVVHSSIPLRLPQALCSPNAGHTELNRLDEEEEDQFLAPVTITWKAKAAEVFLAGTFDELEWRTRERLRIEPQTGFHVITMHLRPGTYRIKFIVDDAWRCSPDMPTAADDDTGNLVNYIDVEDTSALELGSDERQGRDARVMKANRRRTYPRRLQTTALPNETRTSPTTRSPHSTSGRAYHPPLLPPSDSFWGNDSSQTGWEHGRDGVLEKWTNVIPQPLLAAAHQEESYDTAVQAAREVRRGGAGTRGGGTVGKLGMGVPPIPFPPRLPRHLDKVILNTRGGDKSTGSGGKSRRGRKRDGNSTAIGMTSLFSPDAAGGTGAGMSSRMNVTGFGVRGGTGMEKSASTVAMEQWANADDSSVLPVPNHVVLHHLGTSAIKNGVLAVSDTTRYNKKYITTIYYKPTQT